MANSEFPKVISDDPIEIRQEIINAYETAANKKLYPAQTDNFVLNELAYRESLTKAQFNAANKQNYLRYATGILLDEIGHFWKTPRLENELDDKYRRRIELAPEALTTTGTRGGYEYHIRSVSPIISAVSFSNPNPGSGWVQTYILTDEGLPTPALLEQVYKKITSDEIQVLGVGYKVSAPAVVHYELKAKIVVNRIYDKTIVKQQVIEALAGKLDDDDGKKIQDGYFDTLQRQLGVDLIPSRFNEVIQQVEGVHSVLILSPAEDVILKAGEWPQNRLIEIIAVEQKDESTT